MWEGVGIKTWANLSNNLVKIGTESRGESPRRAIEPKTVLMGQKAEEKGSRGCTANAGKGEEKSKDYDLNISDGM